MNLEPRRFINAPLVAMSLLSVVAILLLANQNHWLSEIIHYESPVKIGEKAYIFEAMSLHNEPVNIKQSNALLYFFRLDCDACKEAFPTMIKNYYALKKVDIQLVGIASDNKMALIKFIQQYQIEFPIIADPTQKIFAKYRVHFVPLVVLVDKTQKICFYQNPHQRIEDVLSELSQCVAGSQN